MIERIVQSEQSLAGKFVHGSRRIVAANGQSIQRRGPTRVGRDIIRACGYCFRPMSDTYNQIQALLSKPDPIKWLFAGDSITHGALHTWGWRDYTEIFSERIRYEMGRDRDCIIKTAASGWTIDKLAENLNWCVIQYCPHVVSINMGMNDSGGGPENLQNFRDTYSRVIEDIRKANGATIILHTPQGIQPLDTNRFGKLPAYVEVVRELSMKYDTMLVDHDAEWRQMANMAFVLSDPIHPNEYGHRIMANRLMRDVGVYDPKSNVCRLFVP
jgi:lysophospholipase L1-like esterase